MNCDCGSETPTTSGQRHLFPAADQFTFHPRHARHKALDLAPDFLARALHFHGFERFVGGMRRRQVPKRNERSHNHADTRCNWRVIGANHKPMSEHIRFHSYPMMGIEPMSASTARSYPRHTHDQYGIGMVDSGGHASWSGRGAVEAGPGDFICVNPGEVHDGRAVAHAQGPGAFFTSIQRWCGICTQTLTRSHSLRSRSRAPCSSTRSFVVLLIRRLDSQMNKRLRHQCSLACESAVLRLIAGLRAHSTTVPIRSQRTTPCIRRARARIDDDPAARLTLGDLAHEAGVSRYQLLRGFARELGLTPHAYVLQRRIAMARRLIRAGNSLSEAALASGFCDQSHLNRIFLRQLGVTPGRYAANSA